MSVNLANGLSASALTGASIAALTGLPTTPSGTAGNVASEGIVNSLIASAGGGVVLTVAAISASNIPGTYSGTAGPGDTFTVTATGAVTIDGISNPTSVYLAAQTTGSQDGVYTLTTPGSSGVSAVYTRTTGITSASYIDGLSVIATSGTANAKRMFRCTNLTTITFGTTSITSQCVDNLVTAVNTSGISISPVGLISVGLASSNPGLQFTTGGLGILLATNSCLALVSGGLEVVCLGTGGLQTGASGLSVKLNEAFGGLGVNSVGLYVAQGDGITVDGSQNLTVALGNGLLFDTAAVAVNFADEATTDAKIDGTAAVTPLGLATFVRTYDCGVSSTGAFAVGVTIPLVTHGLASLSASGYSYMVTIVDTTTGLSVFGFVQSVNQSTGAVTVTGTNPNAVNINILGL